MEEHKLQIPENMSTEEERRINIADEVKTPVNGPHSDEVIMPTTSSNLVGNPEQEKRKGPANVKPSEDTSKSKEIKMLKKTIDSQSIEGFVYEIKPDTYTDYNKSSSSDLRYYCSEEEQKSKRRKIDDTTNWSSWETENGVSKWGVRVRASSDQGSRSTIETNEKKRKTTKEKHVAVASKTIYYPIKIFHVNVKLNEKAIKDAKHIQRHKDNKQEAIERFYETYCSFVYSGPFYAGGWLMNVATAYSSEDVDVSDLKKEAKKKLEANPSVGNSGTCGGTNSRNSKPNSKTSIEVRVKTESSHKHASSEDDLRKEIKKLKKCKVFPADVDKSHFISICKIIESQAKATEDKELEQVSYTLKFWEESSTEMDNLPYIVLVGDVGTGKSTIFEKMTGESGKSSDREISYTASSKCVRVHNEKNLVVTDTPGCNALSGNLEHNIWIATAFNYRFVSRIFIVVKAETRIDTVVSNVQKYADCFIELPMDVVAVLVTHMDMVTWKEEDLVSKLRGELGIDVVVFSSIDKVGQSLVSDILKTCTEEHDVTIDSENFSKVFKVRKNHRKILKSISDEVKKFMAKRMAFDEARKYFSGKEKVELLFEFQAYMTGEINKARQRMSNANNFTFSGESEVNEAGHVANMVNQLRIVLNDIREERYKYQRESGISDMRKCPHCGLIWTREEECFEEKTCGNQPTNGCDSSDGVFATFTFAWTGDKILITKNEDKNLNAQVGSSPIIGCGKPIIWEEMQPVYPEFK